jgi:hypothetical protein
VIGELHRGRAGAPLTTVDDDEVGIDSRLAHGFAYGEKLPAVTDTKLETHRPAATMRICNLNDVVNEVFEISGFSTILKVFPSDSEALEGF